MRQPVHRHFADMSRPRQAWESVGGAVASGALCGLLLDLNLWAYVAGVLVSFVGGALAATQHHTLRGALTRAAVGGLVWGGAVIVVSSLLDGAETVPLPDPAVGFLAYAVAPSLLAAPVAWRLARRRP